MICPWKELLGILPSWLRPEVDALGKETLQELRLRCNAPPELLLTGKSHWLHREVSREDLRFVINAASQYSPWTATTISKGFLTAPGGHRIGLCGEASCREGSLTGIHDPTSLCIRVCRDFPGIAENLLPVTGSVLILGAPGWGKTTLLRDLSRQISRQECVGVVDERGEVFPPGISRGKRMDVITGCPKGEGIEVVLRCMSPDWIAVDEITAKSDSNAIRSAVGCGVRLLATAHAATREDLYARPIYRPLMELGVFPYLCILKRDKSYQVERIGL